MEGKMYWLCPTVYWPKRWAKWTPVVHFAGLRVDELGLISKKQQRLGYERFLHTRFDNERDAFLYAERFILRFERRFGYIRRFGVGQMLALAMAYVGVCDASVA